MVEDRARHKFIDEIVHFRFEATIAAAFERIGCDSDDRV